jgi:hypothetical protein
MANYHFKKKCIVSIVDPYNNARHVISSYPDLSFSQTFDEQAQNVKTLHDQNAMFEDAVINKANTANFNFTFLVNDSYSASEVIFEYALKSNPTQSDGSYRYLYDFDLYIDTGTSIFKVEFAVIEGLTLQISRDQLVTATVHGTARKLSVYGPTGTAIPGVISAPNAVRNVTGIIPGAVRVDIDAVEQPNIANISLEISNSVEWIEYDTLHKSLAVTSPSDTMYPEAFFVSNRRLSGSITQYLTDANSSKLNTWSTASSLRIRVGRSPNVFDIDINIPRVVLTNRLDTGDVFTQIYDYRMLSNPADVTTVFDYIF